jgi:hypothetical protein
LGNGMSGDGVAVSPPEHGLFCLQSDCITLKRG